MNKYGALLLVCLIACQPVHAELGEGLDSLRVLFATVDPDDPETTIVSYLPTRMVSSDINGSKPEPLTTIRWTDEKVTIQGYVALLDVTEADKDTIRERVDGKVRFEPVEVAEYHITLKHGDTALEHPVMLGRFGERPAALNLELKVPSDESKEVLEVELRATATATGTTTRSTTRGGTATSPEQAEAILNRLLEKKSVTVNRTATEAKTWSPIEAMLTVEVAAHRNPPDSQER